MIRCRPEMSGRGAIAAVLLSFGLVACVNDVPPPTAQLGASSQAILTAERAGAAQYAPVELQSARVKLAAADAAMRADDRIAARRLAEEAQSDAYYAAAKAQAATQQAATPVPPPGMAGSSTTVTTTGPAVPPAYGGPTSWSPEGIRQSGSSTTTTTTTGPLPLWAPDTTTSVGAGKSVSVGVPR